MIAMKETADMVKKLDNRKLCSVFEDGVLWATGRLENGMQHILGKSKLAILSPKSRLAELIMIAAHYEDHRSTPGLGVDIGVYEDLGLRLPHREWPRFDPEEAVISWKGALRSQRGFSDTQVPANIF